ncbi:MAG: 30S ribosome-binding factor RbfA [Proteobacteria bacterium]|nr:30S ribosome-binding factor RbfA [Pseudomonadota bacterium]MDA1309503.1 30S ribosome-binding factor RbfA [Pseudomonadota bacterium]
MAHQSDKSVRRDGVPSQRQLRVGEVLRKAMVEILERVELRDPDIAGVSITVSEVSVSPDLKAAMVFVMPLGGEAREAVIAGLARAAPFLRGQIARRIQLRHVPRLMFSIDTAFDSSAYMNSLLRTLDTPEEDPSDDGLAETPPTGEPAKESDDGA